jgi:hypothetical protein
LGDVDVKIQCKRHKLTEIEEPRSHTVDGKGCSVDLAMRLAKAEVIRQPLDQLI